MARYKPVHRDPLLLPGGAGRADPARAALLATARAVEFFAASSLRPRRMAAVASGSARPAVAKLPVAACVFCSQASRFALSAAAISCNRDESAQPLSSALLTLMPS
jgi:hypothetical protein